MTTPPYQLTHEPALTLEDMAGLGNAELDEQDQAVRNMHAAGHAAKAILAAHGGKDEPATEVIDLLIDVRHLCDVIGVDFEDAVASSDMHYQAEIEGRV